MVFSAYGQVNSLVVPLYAPQQPARDLLHPQTGRLLSPGEVISLSQQGVDTSTLTPLSHLIWQDTRYPLVDPLGPKEPRADSVVKFVHSKATNRLTFQARVQYQGEYYRLSLTRLKHLVVMRAALLRSLGYYVPSPRYHNEPIHIEFSSLREMAQFYSSAQSATSVSFVDREWVESFPDHLHLFNGLQDQVTSLRNLQRENLLRSEQLNSLMALSQELLMQFGPSAPDRVPEQSMQPLVSQLRTLQQSLERALARGRSTEVNEGLSEIEELRGQVQRVSELFEAVAQSRKDLYLRLSFRHIILEPANESTFFDLHWSFLPSPMTPQGRAVLSQLMQHRPFRALILVYVLTDIPESLNRFSPRAGLVSAGDLMLNHPSSLSFQGYTTLEDLRWLLRKIDHQIDAKKWQDIVALSEIPESLRPLTEAKILHRLHNLYRLADYQPGATASPPPLKEIHSADRLVVAGKVTEERIEGYPLRYSHGDRKSPFTASDFRQYLAVEAQTFLLGLFLDEVNKKLVLQGPDNLLAARQKVIQGRILDHIASSPLEPFEQKLESWGGPVAHFQVGASRHVTTGTYFDSTATIQLVDSLNLGASAGYFRVLDGIQNAVPSGVANLSVNRSYIHVRPLLEVQQARRVPWRDILVFNLMKGLGRILQEDSEESLTEFLDQLAVSEVFTISDSLSLGAMVQSFFPLDALFGLGPISVVNSLIPSLDTSRIFTRQTQIIRGENHIHIYLRQLDQTILGAQLDLNYFLNLLRVRGSRPTQFIQTRAYVLPLNERTGDLRVALRALLVHNDSELLESLFGDRRYLIDHELNTKSYDVKMLSHRASRFTEQHLMMLRGPGLPEGAEQVRVFSHRQGRLVGRSVLELVADVLNGFLKDRGAWRLSPNPNPADQPLGRAHWRVVSAESELPENIDAPPGAQTAEVAQVAQVQYTWGGWKLSRRQFLNLIDDVNSRASGTGLRTQEFFQRNLFDHMNSIAFYRVQISFSIFPEGIQRLRNFVLNGQVNGIDLEPPRSSGLGQAVFGRLSSAMGRLGGDPEKGRFNPSDGPFMHSLVTMLGEGNTQRGRRELEWLCREDDDLQVWDAGGVWYYGTYYDFPCLLPWMVDLLRLKRRRLESAQEETQWTGRVLHLLEDHIPLSELLKLIGEENYIYRVSINGFREGDEDGDLNLFSDSLGDPVEGLEYSGGLLHFWAQRTGLMHSELYRSGGGFR